MMRVLVLVGAVPPNATLGCLVEADAESTCSIESTCWESASLKPSKPVQRRGKISRR
jgi:hypothetical protein